MGKRFQGKVAIVTGAGQGIGETYASRLAAEGAAVVIAELNEPQGQRVAAEITDDGGKALFVETDVSNEESCLNMSRQAAEAFGGIDLLVNNASIFAGMRYEMLTEVDWDYYRKIMAINMDGGLLTTRAVAPYMTQRGGGAIVNQSSTAAHTGSALGAYYGVSKLATNGFTASLAAELGPKNIRVNGVAPGPTDTPAMRQVPKDRLDEVIATLPLGRLGQTDDIANAVLFLLSEEASWITGQTLNVDGGMIRRP